MSRPEIIPINRLMSVEELDHKIKAVEKDVKILKRLYFIKFRYDGDSVEGAAEKIGITKRIGYIWQERWNDTSKPREILNSSAKPGRRFSRNWI